MVPNTWLYRVASTERMDSSVALARHQERQHKQEKHSDHLCPAVIQHSEPFAFGHDTSSRKVALYPSRDTMASLVLTGREWNSPWLEIVRSSVARERHKIKQDKQENNSHLFFPTVIEQSQPSTIEQDAYSRGVALYHSHHFLPAVIEQEEPFITGQAASGKGVAFYPSRDTMAPSVPTGREWNIQLWDRSRFSAVKEKDQVDQNKQEQHSHRFYSAVTEQGEPIGQPASIKKVALYPTRDLTVPSVLTGREWNLHQWCGRVGSSGARENHQVRQNKHEQHSHRFCPSVIEQDEESMIGQTASVKGIALDDSHLFRPAITEQGEPSTTVQDASSRRATVFSRIGTTSSVLRAPEWDLQGWGSVESSVARERNYAKQNIQEKHPHSVCPAVVVQQYEPSAIDQDESSRREAFYSWRHTDISLLQNPSLQNQRKNDANVQHGDIFTNVDNQLSGSNPPTQYNCVICLESSILREMRELPCRHKFHKTCIDNWLSKKSTCPVCRKSARSPSMGTLMLTLVEVFFLAFFLCLSTLVLEILNRLK